MKRQIVLIATLAMSIGACASTPPKPAFSERFITSVDEQGTKKFTYQLALASRKGMRRQADPPASAEERREPRERTQRQPRERNPQATVEKRLEKVMKETAYCEHGYTLTQHDRSRSRLKVEGECKLSEAS